MDTVQVHREVWVPRVEREDPTHHGVTVTKTLLVTRGPTPSAERGETRSQRSNCDVSGHQGEASTRKGNPTVYLPLSGNR